MLPQAWVSVLVLAESRRSAFSCTVRMTTPPSQPRQQLEPGRVCPPQNSSTKDN